jgi:hypothetical protein
MNYLENKSMSFRLLVLLGAITSLNVTSAFAETPADKFLELDPATVSAELEHHSVDKDEVKLLINGRVVSHFGVTHFSQDYGDIDMAESITSQINALISTAQANRQKLILSKALLGLGGYIEDWSVRMDGNIVGLMPSRTADGREILPPSQLSLYERTALSPESCGKISVYEDGRFEQGPVPLKHDPSIKSKFYGLGHCGPTETKDVIAKLQKRIDQAKANNQYITLDSDFMNKEQPSTAPEIDRAVQTVDRQDVDETFALKQYLALKNLGSSSSTSSSEATHNDSQGTKADTGSSTGKGSEKGKSDSSSGIGQ